MTWALSDELRSMTDAHDLPTALARLNLIPNIGAEFAISETAWYPSGSETYGLEFEISHASRREKYFVKACVSLGQRPSDALKSWLARRSKVSQLGLGTPRLVGVGRGLLIEEYIRYDLAEAIRVREQRALLINKIGRTIHTLLDHGFRPLSAHDWRSRGDDVVLVDFGSDLGDWTEPSGDVHQYVDRLLLSLRPLKLSDSERSLLVGRAGGM